MVINYQRNLQRAISREMRKISVLDMSLKITNLRLQPHIPGADELQGNCLSETWIIWTISTLFSAGSYIFAAIRFFHEKQTRWLKQTLAARVSWTQPPRLSTECLPDPNGAAHPPTPVRRNGKRCYLKHFPRNWPFVRGIHRSQWIPHTKANDAELWCFLWSASE